MKKKNILLPISLSLSFCYFFFFPFVATGFTPGKIYTVEELAREADRIVLVRYIEGEPDRRGYRIVTLHRFKVLDTLKGPSTETFEYYQAGGVLGEVDERIEGMPFYSPGEECVLFMKSPKNPASLTAPIGSMQGKFRVWKDKHDVVQVENPTLTHILRVYTGKKESRRTLEIGHDKSDLKPPSTKRTLEELRWGAKE